MLIQNNQKFQEDIKTTNSTLFLQIPKQGGFKSKYSKPNYVIFR